MICSVEWAWHVPWRSDVRLFPVSLTTAMLRRALYLSLLLPLLQTLPFSSVSTTRRCEYESPDYNLTWKYDDLSGDVVFRLSARSEFENYWSGIYFGEEKPTDVIGVYVRSGQIGLTDGHFGEESEGKLEVESDVVTNLQSLSFDVSDGELSAEFGRPLRSSEADDVDLSKCVMFHVPKRSVEIRSSGVIVVPNEFDSFPICDISTDCTTRTNRDLEVVKRDESAVCSFTGEGIAVQWENTAQGIHFTIETEVKKGKEYSAIGVGEGMQNLKMAVLFTENGKPKQTGGYSVKGYKPPARDRDIKTQLDKKLSNVKNGKAVYHITVNREMFASEDSTGCITLQLAINAGTYSGNFNIKKHEEKPIPVKVCAIEKCGKEEERATEGSGGEFEGSGAASEDNQKENDAPKTSENAESGDPDLLSQQKQRTTVEGSGQREDDEEIPLMFRGITAEGEEKSDSDNSEDRQGESETLNVEQEIPSSETREDSVGGESENQKTTEKTTDEENSESDADVDQTGNDLVLPVNKTDSELVDQTNQTVAGEDGNEIGDKSTQLTNEKEMEKHVSTPLTVETEGGGSVTSAVVDQRNATSSSTTAEKTTSTVTTNEESKPNGTTSSIGESPNLTTPSLPTASRSTEIVEGTASLTTKQPPQETKIVSRPCDVTHQDLRVCEGYFADYLNKVEDWAKRHNETVGMQMWKACSLLSTVNHVPTMCCTQFHSTCSQFIQNI